MRCPVPTGHLQPLLDRPHLQGALRRAEVTLEQGINVVLDASWNRARHREEARRLAAATSAALTEARCVAPLEVCARRIAERPQIVSDADADADVLAAMAADYDTWPESQPIGTATHPEDAARTLLARLVGTAPCAVGVGDHARSTGEHDLAARAEEGQSQTTENARLP